MKKIVSSLLSLMLLLSGCSSDGPGNDGGGPSNGAAASEKLDSAVVVEIGYVLNVISQEFEFKYERWTLFNDGSAYSRLPRTALDEFDIEASKRSEPKSWGQWRKEADALVVTWSGQAPKSFKKWFKLETVPSGGRLAAHYSVLNTSTSIGADPDTFFATGWKYMGFDSTGRFEQLQGGSVDWSSITSGVVTNHSSEASGTYRVDGHLLELKFGNGQVRRASLFLSSQAAKTIFINGVQMTAR